ncbi:MAG: VOC family protein [Nitrospirota bacterium]
MQKITINQASLLPLSGLWHLALRVKNLAQSRTFYCDLLGMKVVWEPDPENIYLTLGKDNLALHQIPSGTQLIQAAQHPLDHFGFMVESKAHVDYIAAKMEQSKIAIVTPVRLHRDGSYSFYINDPDGNRIQFLYDPHLNP